MRSTAALALAFVFAVVVGLPALANAGEVAWPLPADAEKMTRTQLGALPDVKVALGKPLAKDVYENAPLLQLKLMRNSIYAQYGVPFKTRWLRDYFETRSWYHAKAKADAAVAAVDADNAKAILAREEEVAPKGTAGTATANVDVNRIAELKPDEMKALPDYKLALGKPVDASATDGKSLVELKLLRNSIFAQLGKGDWQTPWLKSYFESRSWYHVVPKAPAPAGVDAKNVTALKALEDALTPPDAKAAAILDAGSCTRRANGNVESYDFLGKGKLTVNITDAGGYPWSGGQYDGEWRVGAKGLEVKTDIADWSALTFDANTHVCR